MYEVAYLKRKIGNIQLIKNTRERISSKLADLKTGPVAPEGQKNNLSYQRIDIRVGNIISTDTCFVLKGLISVAQKN